MEVLNLSGFRKEDAERIKSSLIKLLPHLNTHTLILCGGIAIRHHLKEANQPFNYDTPVNDLDCQVKNIFDVKPSITQDFLLSHYHDYSGKKGHDDDFYIALVDPETKIKTDFFSYPPYLPFDPIKVNFENIPLLMRNPEDQLATQVLESSYVLAGSTIDPKWLKNIEALMKISDLNKAEKYFKNKERNKFQENITQIFSKIKAYLAKHPQQLKEKPYRKDPYKCELCENRNGFFVEPMEKIYKILDYSE